ncbi:hypothetical protein HMPREF3206_01677 [Fusobacterium equinum]|uniref:Uncharacterized protein n=1 Tax=Fusobacterium equinum TaxID=134605 RepID=A0A133N8W0_9FUSO|nr:hypothetical protein HMPREF3206_01677 [Fusobacterium equinum]
MRNLILSKLKSSLFSISLLSKAFRIMILKSISEIFDLLILKEKLK